MKRIPEKIKILEGEVDIPLKNSPMEIDKDNWYYEEPKHLCLVHQVRYYDGSYMKTDQIYIPWKRLLESIRRKYPSEK